MLRKTKNWFTGLSKVGKSGVILASLFVAGVAAGPSPADTPIPEPVPTPQVQSQSETKADQIEKKTVTETEEIPFEKSTVQDANLESGKTVLRTAGVNGVKTLDYEIVYKNGIETEKKLTSEQVTTQPTTEVTVIGTKVVAAVSRPRSAPAPAPAPSSAPVSNCDPNYSPCVPNVGYDLDCPDIGFQVQVIGVDHHGFDGNDNDGLGCESY